MHKAKLEQEAAQAVAETGNADEAKDAQLARLLAVMRKTSDAIDPAVRMLRRQRHLSSLTAAAVKLNLWLGTALALSLLLNAMLGWFATHPAREYFASDNGRIFPMIPMSQPYRKTADVIQFARDNLTRSLTLDFLNWREQLESVRAGYTRDGFRQFIHNLEDMGTLDTIKDKRMNLSTSAGTGVLVKEGLEDGVFFWLVELPIELRLEGQNQRLPAQRFRATVRVQRVSTLDSISGIATASVVTDPT